MKSYFHHYAILLILFFCFSCQRPNKIEQPQDLPNPNIHLTRPTSITRKIKQDKKGNLLIAAYEGIFRYNLTSGKFTNITKAAGLDTCFALDFLEDRSGNIWIASDQNGAYKYNVASGGITQYSMEDGLAHNRLIDLYEDIKGCIWFSSLGGLSCYDPVTNNFQNLTI